MKPIMVGIGQIATSRTPGDVIQTMALGSCVGVLVLTTIPRTISLLHFALPDSRKSNGKAEKLPGYFADTGLKMLFINLKKIGVNHLKSQILIKLIGGANVLKGNDVFNVGKRNVLSARKLLFKNRYKIIAEDVGGHISRTVKIEFDTGKVFVSNPILGEWEI